GLRPRAAVACLIAVLAGLAVGTYLTIRYGAVEKLHLEQTPEVLTHKAREILTSLGYADRPAHSGLGFGYDTNYQEPVDGAGGGGGLEAIVCGCGGGCVEAAIRAAGMEFAWGRRCACRMDRRVAGIKPAAAGRGRGLAWQAGFFRNDRRLE